MFMGLISKTILSKIINIKDQISNEFIAALLLQQPKTFEEIIADGIKKDSALIQICEDNFTSDHIQIARRILKRIQTAKFQQYWITLPHVTANQKKINSPSDQSQIDDKFPSSSSSSFVACFQIERSKIFNSSGELRVQGREWTQNIYDKLPSKEINCSLAIKKNYLSSSNVFTIYCACQFKNCAMKHVLECKNYKSDMLLIEIFSQGTYCPALHQGKVGRHISGAKRDAIASDVIKYGAKNVQNSIVLSKDMSRVNSQNQEIRTAFATLRQMKSQQLSFASLSSIDSEDIKALRDLTNNMESTEDDPTPSYIKYLRLDCFMVSLY